MKHLLYILVLLTSLNLPLNTRADDDHVRAKDLVESGEILPLDKLLQIAFDGQQWRLLEAELEQEHDRYIYELEILDDKGKVREQKYDAKTGKLLRDKED